MPRGPECKNCTWFRHEGYSACKECDIANPNLNEDSSTLKKDVVNSSVAPSSNQMTDLQSLEMNAPPYNSDEANLRLAHSIVKQEICAPFDCANKKDFYTQFDQEILKICNSNNRSEPITRAEVMQTYRNLAMNYPRNHYTMFDTFDMISHVIESVFGPSAFRYGFYIGEHMIDGVDKEFLGLYYKALEEMPIFERKQLTNGYIHTLVDYTVKKHKLTLTEAEIQEVIKAAIAYYSACYKLRKEGNIENKLLPKPNVVVDSCIKGEHLSLPVKDKRRG